MLRLTDDWIWDSWIADDGETYHLYFLRAPRSLNDPGLRHTAASVGHATSTDLHSWDYRGPALTPSGQGWDDLAIWTGSVVRGDDGLWRMFYTAISNAGHGLKDQRIGVATSEDLHTWTRVGDKPIVEVDPRWYKTLDEDSSASDTWRDPFVFRDPDGDGWHMLITAREKDAEEKDNGVLAHARSQDLLTWEVGPPVSAPGVGFGEVEVAQVRLIEGTPVLTFTCHPYQQSERRKSEFASSCTWSVTGTSMLGPWDLDAAVPFTADPVLFAAPLIQQRDGVWAFVGFQNKEPEGIFDFEIVDPIPVHLVEGKLSAI